MKPLGFAVLLIASAMFGTSGALASCRFAPPADALRAVEADAIVLVLITDLEVDGPNWRATAIVRGILMGDVTERTFSFASEPGFNCNQSWPPKRDRYGVMYLQRTSDGMRVNRVYPYWWARASRDPRLARLDRLLPLGAAREATPEEARLLDLVEARIELPAGASDLSRYTRVYERATPTIVTGMLLRSQTPRRLIVDNTGELPTEESCGCDIVEVIVHLDDLLAAGRLPPFHP